MLRVQGKELDLRVSTRADQLRRIGGDAHPRSRVGGVRLRLAGLHRSASSSASSTCWNSRTASCWSPARPVRARPPRCTPRCRRSTRPTCKIITVEDPVEYQLEGINQIQVKPQIGLDFAGALRSIVRQDPDVIMIGEMRDLETCRIAIQSALTGHLVLSTLHTNSARRRHHAPARHGRGGLPARLDRQRHPGAATGAPARSGHRDGLRGAAGGDRASSSWRNYTDERPIRLWIRASSVGQPHRLPRPPRDHGDS